MTLKLVTRHNRRPAVGHSQKATRDGRVVVVWHSLLTASDHRMCSTSLWQCEHFSTENKAGSNKVRVYTLSSCGVINYYAGIPAIGPKELRDSGPRRIALLLAHFNCMEHHQPAVQVAVLCR